MMRYWNENWLCGPGSYFHGPFGMLINLAFWVGLILLVFWAFRAFSAPGRTSRDSSAVEILNRRYAAGEIDLEQLEEMRQNLRNS